MIDNQILKLCRRLKRCTLEDIVQFTEKSEDEIKPVIYYLLDNDFLVKNNGVYSLSISANKSSKNVKNLYLMQQYHSKEDFEMIIKGFCLGITPNILCHIIQSSNTSICEFYKTFRKKIYEIQHKKLLDNYFKKPQTYRYRMFFEKYAYFYFYNNCVYVSEKPLRADKEKNFSKNKILEFKKVYSYLTRVKSHNINEHYVFHRLAEGIWRRNKEFDVLYNELKTLLFA